MRPDVAAVREFLARAARRLGLIAAAEGAAAGLVLAIVLALFGWPHRNETGALLAVGAATLVAGLLIRLFISRHQRRDVALVVERRTPESRNLIVTAHELSARANDSYVSTLVFAGAARLTRRLDPASLFPARNAAVALTSALALWSLIVARPVLPSASTLTGASSANATPAIQGVDVTVEPPAYTGRKTTTLHDPSRIEALAGSRLSLTVRATAGRVEMETLASHDTLAANGSRFTGTLSATADGYVALEPATGARAGARQLLGLTVLPDAPPHVRITTPGRDQRFPDGNRTLEIAIESSDDIGLASLELRFTKVSGSGERFTFVESKVPITIARRDDRTWTARATWKLDSLKLEPGDMVVYRAVATDHQPSGGMAESDSFIAEVMSPGGVAAPGFETDPEQDRYAVSQQMVILKTERLLVARPKMSADSFSLASQEIAFEQRKVRAEFVFMLGGELADAPDATASLNDLNEEKEAEGEQDILAGRNANAGHVALLRAIRAMSRAATSLGVAEPTTALPYERTALTNLESAFAHSRILLRALTTRERLDLSRRLTGSLTDAVRDVAPTAEPAASARTVALRRILSDVAALAGSTAFVPDAGPRAATLAERVLRIDASSKDLQGVARELSAASRSIVDNQSGAAHGALDRASVGIASVLRGALADAPMPDHVAAEARLNGALVDALRGRRTP